MKQAWSRLGRRGAVGVPVRCAVRWELRRWDLYCNCVCSGCKELPLLYTLTTLTGQARSLGERVGLRHLYRNASPLGFVNTVFPEVLRLALGVGEVVEFDTLIFRWRAK